MKSFSCLIFCLTLILLLSNISIAADTLIPKKSISDGQTLVSSGQVFELGFFSPGISKSRYLGIWYKNIPLTVVWVANRDNPIKDFSGVLIISSDGNLVLHNGNGSVFWSSKSVTGAKNLVAQLLDNGNFVLKEANISKSESYIWQSFDYPTDTLLPGMKQGWDFKTGLNRILTSWKSPDDPSTGDYSYSVELYGLPQLVLRMGSNELYRSGLRYDNQFIGGPVLMENPLFKPNFVSNSEEAYYMYEAIDPSKLSRLVVGQSALVQQFTWISNQRQWAVLFTIQNDHCDTYNLCGPFGVCDINASPNCKCMTGFTPKSAHDWKVFDTFGGCVRTSPLNCEKGEGFVKYTTMKLPDTLNLWVNTSMSTKECEVICLKNCSCTGYADISSGGNRKGCLTWSGNLMDIREANYGYGKDLYVRLSASSLESIAESRDRRRSLKVIISLSILLAMFLLGLILWFIVWLKKKNKKMLEDDQVNLAERNHRGESHEDEEVEFPSFDLGTIAAATNQFSFSNKIGEGGFGLVYKGVLLSGQEVAVKRLSLNSRQGLNELKNEVLLISKLQHRNLVRLLGCCIHGEERMLIYEFMENRSLDAFIFDKARSTQLRWKLRFNIIVGIARGLLYLHRDSRLRIIHRDLKASNILLDNEMNPKISDFGLARTFGGDQTEANTEMVVGTYGYMSPEYAVDGNFSVKSDVFSFGVLALEIVSGRRNRGFYHPEHDLNLLGHAWKLWGEGKALELLDASMGEKFSVNEALKCIHIGLLCVQQRTDDRPTMASVLMMLDGEGQMLPEPKQPGFFTERSLSETDSSSRKKKSSASNEVTITLLEGR